MKGGSVAGLLLVISAAHGCGEGEIGGNPLLADPLSLESALTAQRLAAAPGFADERGGGVFVDEEGRAVRLRMDGSSAPLESHPGNGQAPGAVLRVFPAGPYSALVVADNGLYIAESGWLIEPRWRDALPASGVIAVAIGSDGVGWIAHDQGLFRIQDGELGELTLSDGSIEGLVSVAVAPAPDGRPAVWFAREHELQFARQLTRRTYEISDAGFPAESLADGVLGLAGVSPAPDSPGQLWLITRRGVFQHDRSGYRSYETPEPPVALAAAGRWVWMRAGDALYRYDADAQRWGRSTAPSADFVLMAADASGTLWVHADGESRALSAGPVPRVLGLFEGARIYASELQLRARFAVGAEGAPDSVTFSLGDERIERTQADALPGTAGIATLDYPLGGFDSAGVERGYSLAGIAPGLHTLTVTAHYGRSRQRRMLNFEYRAEEARALSFSADVQPISAARCAKCHTSGPGHELETYEQWVAEQEKIVRAVVELRMPADGPLDPSEIALIQRWVSHGAAP